MFALLLRSVGPHARTRYNADAGGSDQPTASYRSQRSTNSSVSGSRSDICEALRIMGMRWCFGLAGPVLSTLA